MPSSSSSESVGSVDRVFYEILQRVGSRGKYQYYSQVLWCVLSALSGTMSYFIPFLFYQGSYSCPPEFQGSCKDYVCALPQSQRSQFVHFDQVTMISRYGSYLCEEEVELNNIMAITFTGAFVGSILSAILLKFMRKRDIIMIAMVFVIGGISLMLIDYSLASVTFGCFLVEAFICSIFEIVLCFVSEMVDEQKMASYSIQLCISFGIGIAMNGPLFYLFTWKSVLAVFLLLPILGCLIFCHFYVEETIFDMFASLPSKEINLALVSIARRNDVAGHGLTEQEVENIKRQYEQNQMNKNKGIQLGLLDLFKFPSVRKLVILGFSLQFILHYIFSAPEIVVSKYSMSIYLNIAFLGVSAILGSTIYTYFLEDYPRKTVIYVFSSFQVIVLAAILYFVPCVEQCSQQKSMIQTGGLFLFGMLMITSYSGFYILIFEIFPTQIRSQALMVVNIAVGAGELIIPMMVNLTNSLNVSIIWTFFFGNVLVIGLMFFLPETLNNSAPDIIVELSYEQSKYKGKEDKVA